MDDYFEAALVSCLHVGISPALRKHRTQKLLRTQGHSTVQYSPKIMHGQEVAQEVLAPQEHASGEKKLNRKPAQIPARSLQ